MNEELLADADATFLARCERLRIARLVDSAGVYRKVMQCGAKRIDPAAAWSDIEVRRQLQDTVWELEQST